MVTFDPAVFVDFFQQLVLLSFHILQIVVLGFVRRSHLVDFIASAIIVFLIPITYEVR